MENVTIADVLAEIRKVKTDIAFKSTQAARVYYRTHNLPKLLTSFFFRQRMQSKNAAAGQLNMSASSFGRVLSGADISENLLYRIEQFFEQEIISGVLSEEKRLSLYLKPWRRADTKSVQVSIVKVSLHLQEIYDALKTSNQVGGEGSPISVLQKAQIITLLEVMLAELKAPVVDARKASGFFTMLKRILGRGVEKGLEKRVVDAVEDAVSEGGNLVLELSDQVGLDSLDKFF